MRKGADPPAAKAGQALATAAMEIISKPALFELHAGCLPFQAAQVNHHPLRKAAKKTVYFTFILAEKEASAQ